MEDSAEELRLKLEAAKLEVERERLALERYRIVNDAQKPFREAIMKFAELTIRSLLILNGAAALAWIAFVGNAYKGEGATVDSAVVQLRSAVLSFGAGAFLSVLCSGMSYLAQVGFTELADRGWSPRWGEAFRLIAILCAFASLALFACGVLIVAGWK